MTKSCCPSMLIDGEGLALETLMCIYHGMSQLRYWGLEVKQLHSYKLKAGVMRSRVSRTTKQASRARRVAITITNKMAAWTAQWEVSALNQCELMKCCSLLKVSICMHQTWRTWDGDSPVSSGPPTNHAKSPYGAIRWCRWHRSIKVEPIMVNQAREHETSYLGHTRTTHLCKSALLQTQSETSLQSTSERHTLSDSSIVQELVTPQVPWRCQISKLCVLELVYTCKLDWGVDFVACILCCIIIDRLGATACSRWGHICWWGSPELFSSTSIGAKGRPVTWDDCLCINRPLSMLPRDGFEEQVVHSPHLSTCTNIHGHSWSEAAYMCTCSHSPNSMQ